jgi:transcription antitermination factor NusG
MQHELGRSVATDWFALQVSAGREHLAAAHLGSRGYEVFYPRCYEERHWSDRVKRVERALFAGYLFCRLHGDVFGKVLTAPHVIRMVGDGERPLPVRAEEIDALQRVVGSTLPVEACPMPRTGQRVRVTAGPLGGTEGIVLRVRGRDRLVVCISLLRRAVAVEFDAGSLESQPAASQCSI